MPIGSTSPERAAGWYPAPDAEGVAYWDGGRWTGETRAAAPATPWTTWLAWGLLASTPVLAFVLSSGDRDLPLGVVVLAAGVPALAAVLLAILDLVRGRGGRRPVAGARALLLIVLVLAAAQALGVLLFGWATSTGGG